MADLLKLAERVEAATGPDRKLDEAIYPGRIGSMGARIPRYTSSLDAAMTLVPEGFDWAVFRTNGGLTIHAWCGSRDDIFGETPALALCAAALRATASRHNVTPENIAELPPPGA